jgi:hypothetical protein
MSTPAIWCRDVALSRRSVNAWSQGRRIEYELEGAPLMAAATASKFNGRGGGGWSWTISDLKSLLETGKALAE